jgi:hypothetical protein
MPKAGMLFQVDSSQHRWVCLWKVLSFRYCLIKYEGSEGIHKKAWVVYGLLCRQGHSLKSYKEALRSLVSR